MNHNEANDARLTAERLIQRECETLSIAYARYLDFREYDRFVDLFTEGAHLDAGGVIDGRENIRLAMSKRSDKLRSRHILTNIHIDVIDENTATGIAYLTLFRHRGPESLEDAPVEFEAPAAVGHYTDRFERTDQGFRFARRVLSFAFRNSSKF